MRAQPILEEHLSPAQVGERLGLERHAVARLMRPGKIWPVVRISRKTIRVPASAVVRFLQAQTWDPSPLRAGGAR
jgi:predicted site-specific integrase-resolvase